MFFNKQINKQLIRHTNTIRELQRERGGGERERRKKTEKETLFFNNSRFGSVNQSNGEVA